MIGKKRIKLASVDSTGFEAHHVSYYFFRQRLRFYKDEKEPIIKGVHRKHFPKLSIVADISSHVIICGFGSRGPCPDVGQLERALDTLPKSAVIGTIIADAGYDSEQNHVRLRSRNIRSLIPPWHGRGRTSGKPPKGYWRRKMFSQFKTGAPKIYKQRWQIETIFSPNIPSENTLFDSKDLLPTARG